MSYVARQVKVPAEEWAAYDWSGRAIKPYRMEIRGAFGLRECTEEDQAQLAEWLAVELCGVELNRDRLTEAVVARCRKDRLEPPAPLIRPALEAGRMVFSEWPLGANLAQAEELADLAQRRRVLTAVGLQARSAPPLRYLRDLVADGYMGRVLSTSMLGSSWIGGATYDDAGKKVNGRKWYLVVDTKGLPLFVMVASADMTDRNAANEVLFRLRLMHPEITIVWADSAYAGQLVTWAKTYLNLTIN